MRAPALSWSDFDLERGAVVLDENKTNDPRAWALSPGVVEALRAWRRCFDGGQFEIDNGDVERRRPSSS